MAEPGALHRRAQARITASLGEISFACQAAWYGCRVAGQPTIYARELEQLVDAGYRRVGDYMIPPGG